MRDGTSIINSGIFTNSRVNAFNERLRIKRNKYARLRRERMRIESQKRSRML